VLPEFFRHGALGAHLLPLDHQLARSRLRLDDTSILVAIMLCVDFVRGVEGEAKVVLGRLALFELRVVRALESERRNQSAACPAPQFSDVHRGMRAC
jgi:hypothetical protein